jgi:protein TonB
MERPSHSITTLTMQTGTRRFAGAGFAVMTQLAFAAILIGGVVVRVTAPPPPPFELANVRDPERQTPPPPVKLERTVTPTAVPPLIDIAPSESSGPAITVTLPQPAQNLPVVTRQPPGLPAAPDRAAIAVPQTHSAPPYPTLARRLNVEGKVTLRLTVLPDGTVGKAEVAASSGRQDLDQAAQQWIVGHWTYQPAIRGGTPAASQVMAAVEFTLTGK